MILFIVKILDSMITTGKTIAVSRGQKVLASLLVFISQLMFFFVLGRVLRENSFRAFLVVSLAGSVGTYLSIYINDEFSREKEYSLIVSNNDRAKMMHLAEWLRQKKIKHVIHKSLDKDFNETYSGIIFTQTKAESRMLEHFIDGGGFFLRILKN